MLGFGFKNLKKFKEKQWLDFSPITLLTGTNNSGKSSIINGLKLLQDNLDVIGIDKLLYTRFTVKEPKRHGSIMTFVSSYGDDTVNNNLSFYLCKGSYKYQFKLLVSEALEDFGQIDVIHILDRWTDEPMLKLKVISRAPDLKYAVNVNYKYFRNELKQKITNTEKLNRGLSELRKMIKRVEIGEDNMSLLNDYVCNLSSDVRVNIAILHLMGQKGKNATGSKDFIEYFISPFPLASALKSWHQSELGVLFKEREGIFTEKIYTDSQLIDEYGKFLNDNIVNLDYIWDLCPYKKEEFENVIQDYYNVEDVQIAIKNFNLDLLVLLSNVLWVIEPSENEYQFTQSIIKLTSNYLNSIQDCGLLGFLFREKKYNSDDYHALIDNHFLYANSSLDNTNPFVRELIDADFIEKVLTPFSDIIRSSFDLNIANDVAGSPFSFKSLKKNIINKEFYSFLTETVSTHVLNVNLKLNCNYIPSSRYTTDRVINFNDKSIFSALLVEIANNRNKEKIYSFINKWLKEFEIADELITISDSEGGNFKPYLLSKGKKILLSDYGLGTNQLIPIIFSVGIYEVYQDAQYDDVFVKRIVVIEEPEANLHPAMQSKLADLFADVINTFGVQLIIETHSEYLIRKLQYLIGSNLSSLNSDDVVIYYCYKPDHPLVVEGSVSQIDKITIDKYGTLSHEFGSGFFDEADRIALDLFLLKQSQSN